MPNFVITKEGQPTREVTVSGTLIGIGRDARNEICLTDPDYYVSRFHALLVRMSDAPERYFIRDLSSMSGIFVNGTSACQRVLADGDSIQIAGYELIYSRETGSGIRRSRLRVVQSKPLVDAGAVTALMPAIHSRRPTAKEADREEMINEFILRSVHFADIRTRLEQFMPALVRVMNADRGFAGVFAGKTEDYEEVGAIGMHDQDQIEIEDPNAIGTVLAGKPVRELTTLLAPIRRGSRALGFLCIDRVRPAAPFSDEDAAFLTGLSQLMVTDSEEAEGSATVETPFSWPEIFVGKSKRIAPLMEAAREGAVASSNVLILGENGSGKELIARMVHAHSRNAMGPFIARNCAALPETLAESELFGYAPKAGIANSDVQGAPGWFEIANHGTLFLDEVHALSAPMQDKLLRVLEDREVWRLGARVPIKVDVIVISATDKDLAGAVESDIFRKALYHRFARKLHVPALRERKDDVRLLAHYFVDKLAAERSARTRVISQRALDELMNYSWPGNVRELQNSIGSCCSQSGEILFSWDLPMEIRSTRPAAAQAAAQTDSDPAILSMDEVEREKITEALRSTRGNITRAAQLLGYKSRQTMLNKMDHYGIPRDYGDPSAAR